MCDFEQPLIEASLKQFNNALIVGCLFQWKQAVRRRMQKKLHIPEDEIKVAMAKGVLDMLTVIEPELVPDKGIKWVMREIRMPCDAKGIWYSHPKWKAFWGTSGRRGLSATTSRSGMYMVCNTSWWRGLTTLWNVSTGNSTRRSQTTPTSSRSCLPFGGFRRTKSQS